MCDLCMYVEYFEHMGLKKSKNSSSYTAKLLLFSLCVLNAKNVARTQ